MLANVYANMLTNYVLYVRVLGSKTGGNVLCMYLFELTATMRTCIGRHVKTVKCLSMRRIGLSATGRHHVNMLYDEFVT